MATSTSTQSVSGLASGIDTSTIIDQLMSIERGPQNRLKTQVTLSQARKTALTDVQTRLKNLQLAAQDLKSATLWGNTDSASGSQYLVLSAKTTGATEGAFTASATGSLLVEDSTKRVSSRDATYTINGVSKTSPTNVVTDAIPGATITLKTLISATDNV